MHCYRFEGHLTSERPFFGDRQINCPKIRADARWFSAGLDEACQELADPWLSVWSDQINLFCVISIGQAPAQEQLCESRVVAQGLKHRPGTLRYVSSGSRCS